MDLRSAFSPPTPQQTDRVIKYAVTLLVLAVLCLIYKIGIQRPAATRAFGDPPAIACPRGEQPRRETRDGPAFGAPSDAITYLIQTRFPDRGLQDFEETIGTSRARYVQRIGADVSMVVDVRSSGTLFWTRWRVNEFTACSDFT